ncbi:AsmA family protein [Martelella mediterranea]|uniref:AsmA-like protein n=1 Tax=Martelella mediterranea TaxID=293089 RepID=A0A4R3NWJ5_9HYPH|nr:AsmA family protein [Martelella mediterranea]TCT43178.1 AsmA-like protein [Martelella mediterranea]
MLGRILVFFGGLLVLVLFAALLVPYFIDWSHFRQEFETQASRVLGKKVEVIGNVDVRILPFPSVTMHDVRVGQSRNGDALAVASAFSMDAELAPLLSGEIRIFKMALDQPVLNLTLDESGALDWTRTGNAAFQPRKVVFEDVTINDGTVRLLDSASGREHSIADLNASLAAGSIKGPWRVDGEAALDGHPGRFSVLTGQPDAATGSMRLRINLEPTEWPVASTLEGDVALNDEKPVYTGDFRFRMLASDVAEDGANRIPPPRSTGRFEMTNERFGIPEYRLEIGTRADPYVISGEASFDTRPGGTFLLTANGQQFNVERLSEYAIDTKKGRVSAESARQRLDMLTGFLRGLPIPQMPGQVTFRLPALVAGDTTIRDVVLDAEPDGDGWQINSGSAVLPGRTQVEALGRLDFSNSNDVGFSGSLLVASRQPTGLSKWLTGKVGPEIRDLTRAGFSADVRLTRDEQQFSNLQIVAGEGVLDGSLLLTGGAGRSPAMELDLQGNVIDYATLKALAALMVGDDLDGALANHEISAELKADTLNAFGISADDVDAAVTFNRGALSVEHLSVGDLAGAKLTASGQGSPSASGALSGSLKVGISAEGISGFVAMLQQHVPAHPVLAMLDRNAMWFRNTDVTGDLAFDNNGGGSLVFRGSANDSRLTGSFSLGGMSASSELSGQLQISNPDAAIVFGQAGLSPLPIPAPAGGQLSLSLEKQSGDPETSVSLRANSGDTRFTAEGKGRLSAAGFLDGHYDVSLSSPDIEPYLAMNALAVPGTAFGLPVKLNAALDVSPASFAVSRIEGRLDDNAVSGRLNWLRGEPVPRLNGVLSLDHLDLAWLMESVFGPGFDDSENGLSETPFGSAYFDTAEADIDVQAGQFDTGLFDPVSGMSGMVELRGGALALNELAGRWLDGKLTGNMRFGNTDGDGYFQSSLNLTAATLPEGQWSSGGEPVAEGRFDLGLVLETTARTPAGLVSRASGSGMLNLTDLKVHGLNLSFGDELLDWANDQGTDIDNAVIAEKLPSLIFQNADLSVGDVGVPFSISDGRFQARNILVDLPQASFYGAASTELSTLESEATLQATLKLEDEDGIGSSAGFTIGFNGPLADPERSLDLTEMNNYLALRAVERERARVERLQADILEKQRLRRESALYRYRESERQLEREREEAERRRLEDENHQTDEQAVNGASGGDALIESILKSMPEIGQPAEMQ